MILSLAPMEGITGHVFRAAHAECFGALDRYYSPFIRPPRVGSGFGKRDLRELCPGENPDPRLVPQLLTRDADEFVWAARLLAKMGFGEVNLNLGCPSRTVTSRGKGAGFLGDPDGLDAFLGKVTEESPIPVSVKTRLGIASVDEYERILDLYCRYPLAELIVHPRLLEDGYGGTPRWQAFGETLARAPFPVTYNGDMFSLDDIIALEQAFPDASRVMLGRGILANPALGWMARGGSAATIDELQGFHDLLFEGYEDEMGGNAVLRMKEWWSYVQYAFEDPVSVWRTIRKVRKVEQYVTAAAAVFERGRLAGEASYRRRGSLA